MTKETKTETLTIKVTANEKAMVQKLANEKEWSISKWLHNNLIKILKEEQNDEQ